MKKTLSMLLTSAALTFGQTTTPAPAAPKPVAVARPGDVVRVLKAKPGENGFSGSYSILNELYPAGSGVSMYYDTPRQAIIVRGPATTVKLIEDTFNRLEATEVAAVTATVPNVEVTVQLLYASTKEDPKAVVPADLQSTVTQLRGLFPYVSYRVMDVMLLRGRDGVRMEDNGTLAGSQTLYNLRYIPIIGKSVTNGSIRLRDLALSLRIKVPDGNFTSVGLTTDIDAREGQKTVIGKSNIAGTEDAIILVVTPRIVQ